jgi:hypothetical protein
MTNNHTVEFSKNNKYKYEYDESDNLWHKGYDLIFDGFRLQSFRKNQPKNVEHSHNYKCLLRTEGCSASVTIGIHSGAITHVKPHTCFVIDPVTQEPTNVLRCKPYEVAERDVRDGVQIMKKRLRTENKSVGQIYIEEVAKMPVTSQASIEELVEFIPAFRNIKHSLYKHKRKRLGAARKQTSSAKDIVSFTNYAPRS